MITLRYLAFITESCKPTFNLQIQTIKCIEEMKK